MNEFSEIDISQIKIIAECRVYVILTNGQFLKDNRGGARFIYDDKSKAEVAVDALNRTDPNGFECYVKTIDVRVVLSDDSSSCQFLDSDMVEDIKKKLEGQIHHLDIWGKSPEENNGQ